jgi:hypothetical protein
VEDAPASRRALATAEPVSRPIQARTAGGTVVWRSSGARSDARRWLGCAAASPGVLLAEHAEQPQPLDRDLS